ncbi:RHS repeat-associated core domain-containing protein, partial [Anoxybacteroides rupiense]
VWAFTWANGKPNTVTSGNGDTFYYVTNYRGDVVRIIDENGATVANYSYDPWGKVMSVSENAEVTGQPLGYAGYYYDRETKLYYLQARYYDPETARFVSRDQYRGDLNNSISQNAYVYSNNNPVNFTDPSGYWSKTINLGFNSYIKVNVGWQKISLAINLTPGFLISTGIGLILGAGAGAVVARYLKWYLYPILANAIFTKVAEEIVKRLAQKVSKATFRKITKGYNWTKKSIFYKTFQIPNLMFRY